MSCGAVDERCSEYAEEKNLGDSSPMDPSLCAADSCIGSEHM